MAEKRLFSMVERAYAQALLDVAEQAGAVDDIARQVTTLLEVVARNPQAVRLMQSRTIGVRRRDESIRRIYEGKIHTLLLRFFLVINSRERFDEFPNIGKAFLHMVNERHGVVEAQADVAQPMDDGLANTVSQRLGQVMKRQVVLRQNVQQSLIGGIRLHIGDTIADGSVATQLRLLRERLVQSVQDRAGSDLAKFIGE